MKWFIILAIIVGGYYYALLASTNMVLTSTQKLQSQYANAGNIDNQVAASQTPYNR